MLFSLFKTISRVSKTATFFELSDVPKRLGGQEIAQKLSDQEYTSNAPKSGLQALGEFYSHYIQAIIGAWQRQEREQET